MNDTLTPPAVGKETPPKEEKMGAANGAPPAAESTTSVTTTVTTSAPTTVIQEQIREEPPAPSKTRSRRQSASSDHASEPSTPAEPAPVEPVDLRTHTLIPSGVWPPPIYVDQNTPAQERYYMEHRWYAQWEWYDKKASQAKKRYQTLQVIIVVGAAAVPVLVGLSPAVPSVIPIIVSLAVTIAAGIENVFKHGDNWRNFRQAAEELKREKSMYDVKAGAYRKAKRPFLLFVQRCEDVMAKQNGSWLQLSEEQPQQQQQQADDGEAVITTVVTKS